MAGKNAPRREPEVVGEGSLRALRLIFALSFFLAGLYYELCAALVCPALLVWLLRRGRLRVRLNLAFGAALAVFLGYALSCLWAVDAGLAPFGLAKALPLPLAALCLLQLGPAERRRCLGDLPAVGALMTLLSVPLQFVPVLAGYLLVNGRLAGFLQYPNSFALLLLLGLEVLLLEEDEVRPRRLRLVCAALLSFGLLLSGSRAVFLLAIPALLVCLFLRLRRKTGRAALPTLAALGLGALLSLPASRLAPSGVAHLGQISAKTSTFLGRLLYIRDALPVVLRQPFGLGYLGYMMSQRSFQTGVYSVRFVHCEPLQLLLDIGWLPVLIALAALIRALRAREGGPLRHLLLLTLLAHSLLDFDLQFVSLFFVLLLTLDWEQGQAKLFRCPPAAAALAALLCAGALYLGAAAALGDIAPPETALRLYPNNTQALEKLLPQLEDPAEAEACAGRILALDDKVALAWDAEARAAFAQGEIEQMVRAKRRALACAPYDADEYADYFELLRLSEALFLRGGDRQSADFCRREIEGIAGRIQSVLDRTSVLAWRIDDRPELPLPEGYEAYLGS